MVWVSALLPPNPPVGEIRGFPLWGAGGAAWLPDYLFYFNKQVIGFLLNVLKPRFFYQAANSFADIKESFPGF